MVVIFEVSCEFSTLPLSMNFHRQHSNAISIGLESRLELAGVSCVFVVVAVEPSRQNPSPEYPKAQKYMIQWFTIEKEQATLLPYNDAVQWMII